MQPAPPTRSFTQKGILQFICKVSGVLFILQTLFTLQKIISVEWPMNALSQGNLALAIELISNAAICWVLLTKSDWIAEKLDVNSDEVRVSIGKQEFLEIVIIVAGFVLVITSASRIFDNVVNYIYLTGSADSVALPLTDIFSGLFMLAVGLVILKNHKRVFGFISNLRETEHSE
jgi:hypothetical protein